MVDGGVGSVMGGTVTISDADSVNIGKIYNIFFSYINVENKALFRGGVWSFNGKANIAFTNVVFQNTQASLKGFSISPHSALSLLLGGCIFITDAYIVLSGVTFDVLISFYLS